MSLEKQLYFFFFSPVFSPKWTIMECGLALVSGDFVPPTLVQMSGYVQGKVCESGKKTKGLVIDFQEAKDKKRLFGW